jgi:hypothetical protein
MAGGSFRTISRRHLKSWLALIRRGRSDPVALTATRLTELDLPLDWTEQHELLAS